MGHRLRLGSILLTGCFTCASSLVSAAPPLPKGFKPHRQEVAGGQLDWGAGMVVAEGLGKAKENTPQAKLAAERAGEVVAARNALAMTLGVKVDGRGSFSQIRNGEVRIRGVVKGHKKTAVRWTPGATPPECIVTLEVPMWGAKGVAALVYAERRRNALAFPGKRCMLIADNADVSDEVLVIDARGIDFETCLFPSIIGPDGKILYDVGTLAGRTRASGALVRYVETTMTYEKLRVGWAVSQTDEALAAADLPRPWAPVALSPPALTERVVSPTDRFSSFLAPPGEPLRPVTSQPTTQEAEDAPTSQPAAPRRRRVVRAVKTLDRDKTKIVLTQEDVDKLRNNAKGASLLRAGKVLVVRDSVAAGIQGRGPAKDDGEALAAVLAP